MTDPIDLLPPSLPIRAALPALLAALAQGSNAVLQAPPGAGKTTGVPLALLRRQWLGTAKIVMLEPRRLAARAAARRMADLLGEPVGETVGYRVRLDTRVSKRTRIEVVTDGVFTRMIQDDPGLDGIGAVLFDEFHERRLETDLGLALSLDAQGGLRPELRLVAMSATLDAGPVAALMGDAAVITSEGRAFPVEIRNLPAPPPNRLAEAVADAVAQALDEPGGLLVFLPGGGEIRRVERLLRGRNLPPGIDLLPLYGDLDPGGQDRALAPSPPGRRKIVLATSIAETSLTIDGVRQVVDAGLARGARYDPRTGMVRLETGRVSQAGATQRAGRAGRTEPGIAWRLWPEAQHRALAVRPEPEIALADLAPLALELAQWGLADTGTLRLLDPPNPAAFATARRLLARLGALDEDGRLTGHGRRMAELGLAPRLAHMVLAAADQGAGVLATAIAAALGERDIAGRDADLRSRLELIEHPAGNDAARRAREIARRLARQVGMPWGPVDPAGAGAVLALAYPDRIAKRRPEAGRFRLSGGQGAFLPEADPLAGADFLAVADLDGQAPDARIWLAAPLSQAELELALGDRVRTDDEVVFEPATRSVQARRRRRLGALVLGDGPLAKPRPEAVVAALIDGIRQTGLDVLPWSDAAANFRHRIAFLARIEGDAWPPLDDASLLAGLAEWLGPALDGKRSLGELAGLDLLALLRGGFDWNQLQTLDRLAPTHVTVPSGSRVAIDYGEGDTPVLAVKLQEMFGLAQTPTIADGRVRLKLHLLSPARRPIQVTSDLGSFWAGSYKAVRADLRGRYPRHPWPENPLEALPTARAKPRGT
ncbi:MAG TPA: ATP-dependent helicase HrpB [Aliidongia sp.]|uniref:ATP-dependent helicase HrpB n=1 Tax=Aliidongia sp. TaxID=1914230 RepID=UPI002DDC9C27|nr:ATP-dependent helicase HrpB [Aliidongia sp.]HEV2678811.1 ATP-dependent helicase HrpB [Aliidongia sp.]